MELIRGLHNLRPRHQGCVVTIGAFDGVHQGHQAVLAHLLEKSRELDLPSVVVVFEPLPREYFSPQRAPARLMSFREKFRAFESIGIDRVLRIRFNESIRSMGAEEFIEKVFVDGLGMRYIVVGDDLRFGRGRKGDFEMLHGMAERYGYYAMHTDTLGLEGDRVSSTRIRTALENSEFKLAEELLGRPYSISGRVVYGQQLGGTLDVPTANLRLYSYRVAMSGVYAVEVRGLGQDSYYGVANVGTRPTLGHSIKAILEVHLLDFDQRIYGRTIEVIFRKKIRDEKKFDSLDELKKNIHKDINTGRQYFGIWQTENGGPKPMQKL